MENVAPAEESLTSAVPGIRSGGGQAASHQRRARRQRRSARCTCPVRTYRRPNGRTGRLAPDRQFPGTVRTSCVSRDGGVRL
jgi:hypothetical protein